jgi:hypothetical protein
MWTDTKARSEQRFNEINSEYKGLKSDPQNRGKKRQPSDDIETDYKTALTLYAEGRFPMALMWMSITFNRYRDQLGIPRE